MLNRINPHQVRHVLPSHPGASCTGLCYCVGKILVSAGDDNRVRTPPPPPSDRLAVRRLKPNDLSRTNKVKRPKSNNQSCTTTVERLETDQSLMSLLMHPAIQQRRIWSSARHDRTP